MKRSINLVLSKQPQPLIIRRLNVILPAVAGIFFFLFIAIYVGSILYLKENQKEYNSINSEITENEKAIESQKNKEGVYRYTLSLLTVLDQIASAYQSYTPLAQEISDLNSLGLGIKTFGTTTKGDVSINLSAKSTDSLEQLVIALKQRDKDKKFSEIRASGISRDRDGVYQLSLSFKAAPVLLK